MKDLLLRLSSKLERRDIYGRDGDVYMQRYRVFGWMPGNSGSPGPNLYLHRFLRPDEDGELHNHPWRWAVSVMLAGGYAEERLAPDGRREARILRPGMINLIEPTTFHRVSSLLEEEAWTLFCTAPKSRSWGFVHEEMGFVDWRAFLRMKGLRPDY